MSDEDIEYFHDITIPAVEWKIMTDILTNITDEFVIRFSEDKKGKFIDIRTLSIDHVEMLGLRIPISERVKINSDCLTPIFIRGAFMKAITKTIGRRSNILSSTSINLTTKREGNIDICTSARLVGKVMDVTLSELWTEMERDTLSDPKVPSIRGSDSWTVNTKKLKPFITHVKGGLGGNVVRLSRVENEYNLNLSCGGAVFISYTLSSSHKDIRKKKGDFIFKKSLYDPVMLSKFFASILRAGDINTPAVIEIEQDSPLRFYIDIDSMMEVNYFVAPRIEG
jgi:hypothetical protein